MDVVRPVQRPVAATCCSNEAVPSLLLVLRELLDGCANSPIPVSSSFPAELLHTRITWETENLVARLPYFGEANISAGLFSFVEAYMMGVLFPLGFAFDQW